MSLQGRRWFYIIFAGLSVGYGIMRALNALFSEASAGPLIGEGVCSLVCAALAIRFSARSVPETLPWHVAARATAFNILVLATVGTLAPIAHPNQIDFTWTALFVLVSGLFWFTLLVNPDKLAGPPGRAS